MVQTNMEFVKNGYVFEDLLAIMAVLRGEGGCPWDIEQTHQSIRKDLLEEAYETADAIDRNSVEDMKEELGDLLLQVVFHSQIGKENGEFTFDEVVDGICKKLVYRHPHIFSDVTVKNSEEVLNNWDKLKVKEKNMSDFTDTLKSVPTAFPALMRAQKVQKRASKAGYDFENVSDAFLKVEEELSELKAAKEKNDTVLATEELGDLLFSVVNVARFIGADSEESLTKSVDKFIRRFEKAEELAKDKNQSLDSLSAKELDVLWNKAKELLK